MKRLRLLIILIILGLGGLGVWQWSSAQPQALALEASGIIEAEEINVAAEVGGRVREILVDEGATVRRGDILVHLDDSLLAAQIAQAQAAVATAKANLAQVKAGTRPEEIAAARAALAQALASREGAKRAWKNAQRTLDNPQELDARIDAARTQLAMAKSQAIQAQAALESAKVQRDRYPDQEAYEHQVRAAEEALQAAQANVAKAQAQLDGLLDMRNNPLALRAQVDAAEAAYKAAVAAAEAAQAKLDALVAGPTQEQIAVAEAAVRQAEATLGIFQVQKEKMTLRAPLDGLVTRRALRVGELASPGAPVMIIADLTKVRLTVYIPADQLGRVRLGQRVRVTVDSFPGRAFVGEVVYISPQAEFTPKNIQTQKERANMVFAVRIRLDNPELLLKPGMPADAVFM